MGLDGKQQFKSIQFWKVAVSMLFVKVLYKVTLTAVALLLCAGSIPVMLAYAVHFYLFSDSNKSVFIYNYLINIRTLQGSYMKGYGINK